MPSHLHHVIPVAKGGGNEADNLVVLCPNCHAMAHRIRKFVVGRHALIRLMLTVLTGQPTQRALTDVG
jgi:predicted HNH restriction endonuclease